MEMEKKPKQTKNIILPISTNQCSFQLKCVTIKH